MHPTELIVAAQQKWAKAKKLAHVGRALASIESNLFQPMHAATVAEFANGDGDELGTAAKPGKMCSLRSSSALAVNFFDYWRYRSLTPLAKALDLEGDFVDLHFEQKFPTGLRGKRPNIDVVMFPHTGAPVGVECKFCEPYDALEPREAIDSAYFPSGKRLWTAIGLARVEEAAQAVGHSFKPVHLDAGQLLKHILALGHTYPRERPIRLLYLWFDDGSSTAVQHRSEMAEFGRRIEHEVEFLPRTYQEVFARLASDPAVDRSYACYLESRYFCG